MNPILAIVVFSCVLFIYLHVYHHVKVSNDLDVYEVEQPSKDRFEEICSVRQPSIFEVDIGDLCLTMTRDQVVGTYDAFDLNIRGKKEDDKDKAADLEQPYVPLAFGAANELLLSESTHSMFSERNTDFLNETGLINKMKYNDGFLRPPMVSKCAYDWLLGSNNTQTPFRYEIDYRTYLVVTEGIVKLKLAPPKSTKHLYLEKDFNNFEFRSPVNPWKPQPQYKGDFSRVKCLEITLTPGKVFYLPPYWWYSIEFGKGTSVCKMSYQTYMGALSVIHYHALAFLQRNNTRDKVAKMLNNETNEQTQTQLSGMIQEDVTVTRSKE